MIKTDLNIYLASKSPRRRKLLKQINIDFKPISVNSPESIKNGESPVNIVKRLALEKLFAAKEKISEGIIITADTIVYINGHVLGKPVDVADAEKMLRKLSGETHSVYTGYAIYNSNKDKTVLDYEKTLVKFRKISSKEIEDYVATGSPMDKAGAYGIQDDFGAVFVEKITGCYYNVVGLPLSKLYTSLQRII